jgi:hypothetical protein
MDDSGDHPPHGHDGPAYLVPAINQMVATAFFGYAPIVGLYGVGSSDPFQKLIVLRFFWPLFPGIPRFQYTYGYPNTKNARAAARH